MIVLKNINGSAKVDTIFRGRKVVIKPKHSLILPDGEEGKAEAQYLTSTFGFVLDITKLMEEQDGINNSKK
jgi:hypothetical protein